MFVASNHITCYDLICRRWALAVAIGKGMHVNSRVLIEKDDGLFPDGALSSNRASEQGFEQKLGS
jgi:hypothetical protein